MAVSVSSPGDPCHSSCSCRYTRPIVLEFTAFQRQTVFSGTTMENHLLCAQERVRDEDTSVGSAPLGEEMQGASGGRASIPAWGQAGV